MPCRDYYDEHPEEYYKQTMDGLREQVSFAESVLCQTLAAFQRLINTDEFRILKGETPLNYIDFKEAGVTLKEVDEWWIEHKLKDERSRAMEEERRQLAAEKKRQAQIKAAAKKSALAKLTPEERQALGLSK